MVMNERNKLMKNQDPGCKWFQYIQVNSLLLVFPCISFVFCSHACTIIQSLESGKQKIKISHKIYAPLYKLEAVDDKQDQVAQ